MIYSAKQMPSYAVLEEGPMFPGILEMALKAPAFERVPREQHIPMSIAQERLWLASQFDDAAARYSITVAMRLQSEPDEAALRESARVLVARHDALRTVLQFKDGLPCQTVRPEAEFEFSQYDFGHMSLLEQKHGLNKVLTVESTRPFNLQSGPLCRMALIRLDAGRSVLALSFHRVIADRSSVAIFVRELSAVYRAMLEGRRCPLPELWLQFGDFAAWQRRALESIFFKQQLDYWRRQLAPMPAGLRLPRNFERPATRKVPNTVVPFDLPAGFFNSLKELARQEGATLFMALMAAYQSLLHLYCGQNDLVVGTPVNGRDHRPVEFVVGPFENLLAIRANFEGRLDFRMTLRHMRRAVLEAYSNRHLPFERIADEFQSSDSGASPIFQTVFTWEESPLPDRLPGDLHSEWLPLANTYSQFDLALRMREHNSELGGEFIYRPDVFTPGTIENMARHFQRLLEGILDPARPLAEIA
jgi:hypothetical protein